MILPGFIKKDYFHYQKETTSFGGGPHLPNHNDHKGFAFYILLILKKPPALQVVFYYIIDDPLLRFWFRFVFPNLSFFKSTGESRTVIEKINPQLDAYFGYCFESLCREALIYIYQHEQIDVLYTIGEYWDKNIQIDVVGIRDDNRIDIGECKWGKIKSLKTLCDEFDG